MASTAFMISGLLLLEGKVFGGEILSLIMIQTLIHASASLMLIMTNWVANPKIQPQGIWEDSAIVNNGEINSQHDWIKSSFLQKKTVAVKVKKSLNMY